MKQIASFMSEISDEFKIVVVGATRTIVSEVSPKAQRYDDIPCPTMLREEGGYEYKKSIVDTVISIIEDNPDAKEAGFGTSL